jgi:hypothetical protein
MRWLLIRRLRRLAFRFLDWSDDYSGLAYSMDLADDDRVVRADAMLDVVKDRLGMQDDRVLRWHYMLQRIKAAQSGEE